VNEVSSLINERDKTLKDLAELTSERDRVLAAVGHDLRNPIVTIRGICTSLMDGDLREEQRKWLQRIRSSSEVLVAMLNGILESVAPSGEFARLNIGPVMPANLIVDVVEVLRPQAEEKGLILETVIDPSVNGPWKSDALRLQQIVFNLCGNAIKFTQNGRVTVCASIEGQSSFGQMQLVLSVSDTGKGISESESEDIFKAFRRGREEVSRGQEGLGLGLYVCKQIAELFGGKVEFTSSVGNGAEFVFIIPIERDEQLDLQAGMFQNKSALVVGLSEGVRRRVASSLEYLGFYTDTAADGFLAMGLAERIRFRKGGLDLMIVDDALTDLSAKQIFGRLRASDPSSHTRMILVSSGDVDAEVAGNMDGVIPHPAENNAFQSLVVAVLAEHKGSRTEPFLATSKKRAPSVLIVEDSRWSQELFADEFSKAGFSVSTASNGREAVEAVERGGFDVIVMDVQMPEIDGIEATRQIRGLQNVRGRPPIVGLTASTGADVRQRCTDAGMDLVLHKTTEFSSLPNRILELVGLGSSVINKDFESNESGVYVNLETLTLALQEIAAPGEHYALLDFIENTDRFLKEKTDSVIDFEVCSTLCDELNKLTGTAAKYGAVGVVEASNRLKASLLTDNHGTQKSAIDFLKQEWQLTKVAFQMHLAVTRTAKY